MPAMRRPTQTQLAGPARGRSLPAMQTQHGGADTTPFSVAGRKRARSDSSDDPRPRAWRRAFKHLLLEHAADVGSVNNNILLAAACAVIRLKLSVDYGVQNMGSILQSEHCNTVAMVLEEIRQESSKATRYACLCNLRHRCSLPAPADSIYRADTYAGSTMRTSLSCWKGNLCRAHAEITCRARRSAPGQGRRRRPRSSRARPSRARGPRSRHRPGDDGQRSELQRLWRAARTAAIVRGRWTDGADGLREQRKPAAKQFHFRCHRFGFLRRGLFPACWQTTPRQQTPFLLLSLNRCCFVCFVLGSGFATQLSVRIEESRAAAGHRSGG